MITTLNIGRLQESRKTEMKERQKFASDLELMKVRAMELGLFATMQRMDYPIRMVGFEIGGAIEGCTKYEEELRKVIP